MKEYGQLDCGKRIASSICLDSTNQIVYPACKDQGSMLALCGRLHANHVLLKLAFFRLLYEIA